MTLFAPLQSLARRLGRFVSRLWRQGRAWVDRPRLRRSALFDAGWYLDSYPDLRQPKTGGAGGAGAGAERAGMDPALHYLIYGAAEGRDPGPGFSTSGYRLQGWQGRGNPLLHHLAHPGAFAALPVFAGTQPAPSPSSTHSPTPRPAPPVVLFCGHQALGQQFGAERSFLHMLDRAARAGLVVEVVLPHCLDPGYLAACRARARVVHLVPQVWRRAGRVPHPQTLAVLERLIRHSGAVEVHQNTLTGEAALIAARAAGVASVVHLRELPEQDAELCARLGLPPAALRAALLAQAGRFVANAPAVARWIDPKGSLAPGRVVVQPNAVDPALLALDFAPQTPLRVALIGSNTAKKGIADARAVALECARLGLAVQVLLIGPDSADLAALGPLPANMRHAGYAPGPVAALAQADVVLCLSRFAESFGRTVLESMAAGRPVIAYDRGTPPELIGGPGAEGGRPGQMMPGQMMPGPVMPGPVMPGPVMPGPGMPGRVVPADDPPAVAQALRDLLAEPGALRAASQAARARAADLLARAAAVPDAALYAAAVPDAAPYAAAGPDAAPYAATVPNAAPYAATVPDVAPHDRAFGGSSGPGAKS